ncbi:MAG: ParB/RepB/Spo0J family partition protein [Acidaminobacteraceae bacterium]
MTKAKRGLGKGLGALIPDEIRNSVSPNMHIEEIKLSAIRPNKDQPRKTFDSDKIDALAISIKEHGVVQPIVVRNLDNHYQIVAGERRWQAAKTIGLDTIPCVIKEYDDSTVAEIALVENLQREDLNDIEEALAYSMLIEKYSFTQEKLSVAVGKSRSNIANTIRLLKLDKKIQKTITDGEITGGHARALLRLSSVKSQFDVISKIKLEQLSVREVEKMVKNMIEPKEKIGRKISINTAYMEVEEKLKDHFGTKVIISDGKKKGKIEIEFYSDDELDRIIEMLNI